MNSLPRWFVKKDRKKESFVNLNPRELTKKVSDNHISFKKIVKFRNVYINSFTEKKPVP